MRDVEGAVLVVTSCHSVNSLTSCKRVARHVIVGKSLPPSTPSVKPFFGWSFRVDALSRLSGPPPFYLCPINGYRNRDPQFLTLSSSPQIKQQRRQGRVRRRSLNSSNVKFRNC